MVIWKGAGTTGSDTLAQRGAVPSSERLGEEGGKWDEVRGQQVAARGRARWVALLVLGFLACAAGWGTQGSGPAQVTGRARV